jgi:DNA polymerase/3'-5' exonuclease PolX
MAQHVRLGLIETETILLYHAHSIADSILTFLLKKANVKQAEAMGDYRRRVETISRFDFLVQAPDFGAVIEAMKRYAGRTSLVEATPTTATYSLPSGPLLCIEHTPKRQWASI